MDIIFYIVLSIMVFGMYLVLSFTINLLLLKYTKGYKLPISHLHLDKKTPLYKIVKSGSAGHYSIQKWELGYGDVKEEFLMLLLGAGLFRSYGYRYVDKFGLFNASELKDITDLATEYEKAAANDKLTIKPITDLDRLNKRFNSNYSE